MRYLFILGLLFLGGCSKDGGTEYYYEVTGSGGSFDVTIEGAPSGTAQFADVRSGWRYKWNQYGTRWLYVSAQNNNSSGDVTVKIVRRGKVKATQTSSGGYVIATVSGEY